MLSEGLGGCVVFGNAIENREQLARLVSELRTAEPGALIALDEEGGDVTRLYYTDGAPTPGNAALGAVDDVQLTEEVYQSIGTELRNLGVNLNFAPVADVNAEHGDAFIGTRSFGSDPDLVARHTAAAVNGLQRAGVAACVKHYPGHGATAVDSHLSLPVVDATPEQLRARELKPFQQAVNAGARAVMTGHIRVPSLTGEEAATFAPAAIDGLLRRELGFTGVVVTDALDMAAVGKRYNLGEAAVQALRSGCDVIVFGEGPPNQDEAKEWVENCVRAVEQAVETGRLPLARLKEASENAGALRAWIADAAQAPAPPANPAAYENAASRALTVHGELPPLSDPLVVHLRFADIIDEAAGEVPWDLEASLAEVFPAAEVLHVTPEDAGGFDLGPTEGRQVIFVSRNTHRLPSVEALLRAMAERASVVLVDLGWPVLSGIPALRARIDTYGTSRTTARAVARMLADGGRPASGLVLDSGSEHARH
ncbi:glycoside hydrolase family 3 N-terminal domain-containing protein [Streptomyces californicus]|uniref:glycoside hydrolase family 3 protein n=1 Tax=Streptomyces californicus TaxID=67351 RepID=UPI00296FA80F|nr:glycoside hydrolase family 3 N-terminal domain-containing protein [Streptomyces californicus]MDW4901638.1 glycoside hydrolase family 3 N-terminal domain-containing protein [Streptomyces californicus]